MGKKPGNCSERQARGEFGQQDIPVFIPQGIVHRFEIIQIEDAYGHGLLSLCRLRQSRGQIFLQSLAIGQPRQFIRACTLSRN